MKIVKYLFLFSFMCSALLARTQDHKFALGLTASADLYNLDFDLNIKHQPYSPGFEKQSNPGNGFGMRIQFNFNDQLFIRSGLFYATKDFSYHYHYIFDDPDDTLIPKESRLRIYHLGVPLMLGHHVINKEKFKLSPSAGIVGEYYTGQKETTIYEDNSEQKSEFLHQHLNHLISAQINIGVEYHFNKRIFLTAEPYAKIGMNIPADPAHDNKLNGWGGILSLNCNL